MHMALGFSLGKTKFKNPMPPTIIKSGDGRSHQGARTADATALILISVTGDMTVMLYPDH